MTAASPTPERARGLLELAKSDIAVWAETWAGPDQHPRQRRPLMALRLLLTYMGLRATLIYRISHALHRSGVRFLPQSLWRLNITLHGLDIPPIVPIGPRLYIPHPVGTVVMAQRIGSRATLVSCVTIGMRNERTFPRLGDNVYVGAGARILGEITIGSDVAIGANAVVLRDVPDDSVAIGVPAVIRPRTTDPTKATEPRESESLKSDDR